VTFVYEVADNNGATSQETVTITVSGTNDGPVAQAGVNTAVEDGTVVSGTLVSTDAEGTDTHSYSLISGPSEGSATVNADGSYTFNPENDFQDLAVGESRNVTFVYQVEDGAAATSQATVTVTVSGTNDGPVAQAGTNTATEDGSVVSGSLVSSDVDTSDTHSYSLISGTSEGTAVVNSNGSYTFDPGSDFQDLAVGETRDVTFVYEVADNNGATSQETVTITVSGSNDGPVAQAGVNTAVEDGAAVSGTLVSTDAERTDTHNYSLISGPSEGSATVNADGSYTFDPESDFQNLAVGESRNVTFVYQVEDGAGATSQATVTVTVSGTNDGPVAQAGTNTAIEDGSVVSGTLVSIDVDTSDTHSYSLVSGTSEGTAVVNSNGSYTFDPGSDFQDLAVGETRDVTFVYEVADNNGATSQETVTITVSGSNDGPVAQAGVNTAVEDGTAVSGTLVSTDAEGTDTHSYSLISGPSEGSATVNADGSYTFDPESDFQDLAVGESRNVTFVYQVEDGAGATSQATVTVTVSGTNDGPVAQAGTNTATEDGSVVSGTLVSSDVDTSDTHSYSLISGTSEGTAVVNSNGSYTFDPESDFQDLAVGESRNVTFVYQVEDGAGATSQATVTVTVSGTNDGPVAQAGTNTAIEDGSVVSGTLVSSDVDTSDTHSYSLVSGTSEGTALVNSNGSYTFDPGSDFQDLAVGETRDVTFVYEVADNNGATSQETVTITVSGSNDGPVAQAGTNTATEDGSVVSGTLVSSDVDTSDTHSYSLVSGTSEGTAVVNSNGSYTFDPGSDFQDLAVGETRDVTFVYEVADNNGGTSQETVTITVSGTNDGPIANADHATTREDDSVTLDVLANDTDIDLSDRLTVVAAQIVDGSGSVAIEDNQIIFSPGSVYQYLAPGETAEATITYQVRDSQGEIRSTTATVQIEGQRDHIVIAADAIRGQEDAEISWPIRLSSVDLHGPEVTAISVTGLPAGSTLSDASGHVATVALGSGIVDVVGWDLETLVVRPPTNFSGNATVAIAVQTADGDSSVQTSSVEMELAAVADRAILAVSPVAGQQDTSIPLSIQASLTDTDGSETMQLSIGNVPAGAMLTDGIHAFVATAGISVVDATGWDLERLTFTPAPGSFGGFRLQVIATTTEANGSQATVQSDLNIDVRQTVLNDQDASRPTLDDAKSPVSAADVDTGKDESIKERSMVFEPSESFGDSLDPSRDELRTEIGGDDDANAPPTTLRALMDQANGLQNFDFQPVDAAQDGSPSNWRLYDLFVLENAQFESSGGIEQEVITEDDAMASTVFDDQGTATTGPELENQTASKQTFGMLWALVRGLSGILEVGSLVGPPRALPPRNINRE
jgi:VCBS repeat-containing protein